MCSPQIIAVYRGTSLIKNSAPLGPYSRNMFRALWWSYGGGALSYERGAHVRADGSDTIKVFEKGVCAVLTLLRCNRDGTRQGGGGVLHLPRLGGTRGAWVAAAVQVSSYCRVLGGCCFL